MKLFFSMKPTKEAENMPLTAEEKLLQDIQKTKWELETAYAGFDYVTDPDLIDCYIYRLNSVMKRYKYLLEQAALLNMTVETKNELTA